MKTCCITTWYSASLSRPGLLRIASSTESLPMSCRRPPMARSRSRPGETRARRRLGPRGERRGVCAPPCTRPSPRARRAAREPRPSDAASTTRSARRPLTAHEHERHRGADHERRRNRRPRDRRSRVRARPASEVRAVDSSTAGSAAASEAMPTATRTSTRRRVSRKRTTRREASRRRRVPAANTTHAGTPRGSGNEEESAVAATPRTRTIAAHATSASKDAPPFHETAYRHVPAWPEPASDRDARSMSSVPTQRGRSASRREHAHVPPRPRDREVPPARARRAGDA